MNTESVNISTSNISEVSTAEMLTMINNEDKTSPVPDDALTEILNKKGYKIARRTVAKYREQLNIPVARLRREL